MAQNAEKFLDIFNGIEKHLKSKYNNGNYLPFHELLRRAAAKEGVIKKFREDLFTYADLRNVMVHSVRINGKIIAEPLDEVIERIDYIWNQVQHPEKVSRFKKKVYYCFSDDILTKALQFMSTHKISQVPVLEKGIIVDVLNASHIADWLTVKKTVASDEVTVGQVLDNAERNRNFDIIPENMSVFDAAEIYKSSFRNHPVNWYYDALVITPKGKPEDLMTGIIVLKDIAEYISM